MPFCAGRCPYCDFASTTDLSLIPAYLEAVKREVETSPDFGVFDTLYFGGGTPGILPEQEMETLFGVLRSRFCFSRDAEVTVEMNPECVTKRRVVFLRSLGVNRLSIGIQSLNDDELRFLGRRHTARQALEAVFRAHDAGCANISADLICGFDGQTILSWTDTLSRLVGEPVSHLSAYQLTVKEGTPFGNMRDKGQLCLLSEDEEAAFFEATCGFFRQAGWTHYEVSNYCRGPQYACRHNILYWRHQPYLGIGPSAASFDGRRRWRNAEDVSDYCRLVEEKGSGRISEECLTDEQLHLEKVALALRTAEGVAEESVSDTARTRRALEHLEKEGIVSRRAGRIVPTEKGFLLADGLPLLLLD